MYNINIKILQFFRGSRILDFFFRIWKIIAPPNSATYRSTSPAPYTSLLFTLSPPAGVSTSKVKDNPRCLGSFSYFCFVLFFIFFIPMSYKREQYKLLQFIVYTTLSNQPNILDFLFLSIPAYPLILIEEEGGSTSKYTTILYILD